MRVWLLHLAEMLPIDESPRLFRYGMLADILTRRGHDVVYWGPTFAHYTKKFRSREDRCVEVSPGYRIHLLHAGGYRTNVSLSRIAFQFRVAFRFRAAARQAPRPDVIVASMPTPSICLAALTVGAERAVPVLVDVRDLWPDALVHLMPRGVRMLAGALVSPVNMANRSIFSRAAGITAIAPSYLRWGLRFAGRAREDFDGVFPMGYRVAEPPAERQPALLREWEARLGPASELRCCFFGTMGRHYRIQDILDAAEQLPAVSFVLCGDGDRRHEYQKEAAGLENVLFPGWVDSEAIWAVMKLSDVGLAPYREGAAMSLPNKPFEYMAGGLPVVSSLPGELADLLRGDRCGFTYRPGHVDQLADTLRRLKVDRELRVTMGRRARRLFESTYRADRVYGRMSEHLEHVAATAEGV